MLGTILVLSNHKKGGRGVGFLPDAFGDLALYPTIVSCFTDFLGK